MSSNLDSYLPMVSTLVYRTPAKTEIVIPTHEYLQSIEVETQPTGGWKGRVVLFDRTSFLESLILGSGPDCELAFRYGFLRDGISNLPLHRGAVLTVEPELTMQGITLTFELVSKECLECVLDRRARSFKSGLTASMIFREIAQERKWRTVDRNGYDTVEDSVDVLDSYAQTGESDVAFIRRLILPHARNAQGNGYVFFFDIDNVAHFHSLDFSKSRSGSPHQLAKTYLYARDKNGEVISFKPKDNVIKAMLSGAGNSSFTAIDAVNGVATEKTVDQLKGVDGAQLTGKQGAIYRPSLPETLHAKATMTARDVPELERLVSARYSLLASQTYGADLEVIGTHAVRPMDYVSVRYVLASGADYYLSGVFQVMSVRQSFNNAGFKTEMGLSRLGHQFTPESDRVDVKRSAVVSVSSATESPAGVQVVPVTPGSDESRR